MVRSLCLLAGLSLALLFGASAAAAKPTPNTPPWRWSDEPDLYPKVELRARRLHSVYALREVAIGKGDSHAELRRELSKGGVSQVVWRTAIKARQWTDLAGAAMIVSGDTIFVARYNRIATGCTLRAFSTADGKERWSVQLVGIGPIGHSKWFNRVQLDMESNNPVVFGNEGPGRGYIEVRSAKTGALISNAQRPVPGGRPRVLAEALYHEIARALGRRPRYGATLANFTSRHRFTFASEAERDRAFRTAALKLDGLPFDRGRMRVSVAPNPDGTLAVKARRR